MWGGGPTISLAIQSTDLATALTNEPLVVTGLHNGVYVLRIDGDEIGTYTNEQLAKGVNLGSLSTPMSEQAMQVYQLTTQHVDLHWDRWRHVQVPLAQDNPSDLEPALLKLDALEQYVVEKERKAAQPKEHSFSIKPVV